jgi:hypothetical protein
MSCVYVSWCLGVMHTCTEQVVTNCGAGEGGGFKSRCSLIMIATVFRPPWAGQLSQECRRQRFKRRRASGLLSVLPHQADPIPHPASYSQSIVVSFPVLKAVGSWSWPLAWIQLYFYAYYAVIRWCLNTGVTRSSFYSALSFDRVSDPETFSKGPSPSDSTLSLLRTAVWIIQMPRVKERSAKGRPAGAP